MNNKVVVKKKKDIFCNNDLVENIRNEINFLEAANNRTLEDQEIKLIMLVNLLEYMEDESSVHSIRHKEINTIISNKKLLLTRNRKDQIMKKNNEQESKNTLLKIKKGNKYIVTLTNDNYNNCFNTIQKGKAYLKNDTTNKLKYQDGFLYLESLKELTKAELRELKSIDLNFLNAMFTLVINTVIEQINKQKDFRDLIFEVKVIDLYKYLHNGRANINKKDKERLIEKLNSYNNIRGHIEREEKEFNGDYNIFSTVKHLYETDTITFVSPYFEYLLACIFKDTKKSKEVTFKNGYNSKDFTPWCTKKVNVNTICVKDNSAKEIVHVLAKLFTKCGKRTKIASINILTIIANTTTLAADVSLYADSKDLSKILERHFEKAYEMMREDPKFTDSFIIPNKEMYTNIKEYYSTWIPNKNNYKDMTLYFKRVNK